MYLPKQLVKVPLHQMQAGKIQLHWWGGDGWHLSGEHTVHVCIFCQRSNVWQNNKLDVNSSLLSIVHILPNTFKSHMCNTVVTLYNY